MISFEYVDSRGVVVRVARGSGGRRPRALSSAVLCRELVLLARAARSCLCSRTCAEETVSASTARTVAQRDSCSCSFSSSSSSLECHTCRPRTRRSHAVEATRHLFFRRTYTRFCSDSSESTRQSFCGRSVARYVLALISRAVRTPLLVRVRTSIDRALRAHVRVLFLLQTDSVVAHFGIRVMDWI